MRCREAFGAYLATPHVSASVVPFTNFCLSVIEGVKILRGICRWGVFWLITQIETLVTPAATRSALGRLWLKSNAGRHFTNWESVMDCRQQTPNVAL